MKQIKFRPKLYSKNYNPSLRTGVKLVNKHTAGQLNAHNVDINIRFLDSFLTSFNDKELKFCNYIKRLGIKNTYIYRNLRSINDNPAQLANDISIIDVLHRKNSSRIHKILNKATNQKFIQKFEDSIFEIVVNRGSDFFDPNGKGRFRVFSVYLFIEEKQYLLIILIDPYHLVCPVADRTHSKDENMNLTYQQYKDLSDSLESVFKKRFKQNPKIKWITKKQIEN